MTGSFNVWAGLVASVGLLSQGTIVGIVRSDDGAPLSAAMVEIRSLGLTTTADSAGRFAFEVPAGVFEVRASAFGYTTRTRHVEVVVGQESQADFILSPEPIHLMPLTGYGRSGYGGERARFERESAPGRVGLSGDELRAIPAVAEPDVLRSLQAIPGVASLNDLNAGLHVYGGAADQNVYLWDGIRIFAPYHMFGMVGAFNADAVGRVDLYRGHFPPRYGGALSAVVDIDAPPPTDDDVQGIAGVGLLGLRATLRGQAHDRRTQWLFAARRTHADVVADKLLDRDFPYRFYDVHGRLATALGERGVLSAAMFASNDYFDMFLDGESGSLQSDWRNTAGGIRWTGERAGAGLSASAWGSRYDGQLRAGRSARSPSSGSRLVAFGVRAGVAQNLGNIGYRIDADMERASAALSASDMPGGFIAEDYRGSYLLATLATELEGKLGPVRFSPGLRVSRSLDAGFTLVEPRLAVRADVSDNTSLTLGFARSHQVLSALSDDRFLLPGAPFWYIHASDEPPSRSNTGSAAADVWLGRGWSAHLNAHARSFRDVISWRPQNATRSLSEIEFHDGSAHGLSAMLRRHEGRVTGWAGYGLSRVRLRARESDADYAPPWDRRHSADVATFFHANDHITLSARLVYGSGQPFWPETGRTPGHRFSPIDGSIESSEDYPAYGDEQLLKPDYYRLDGGIRARFRVFGQNVEGYANMINLRLRRNVLFYRYGVTDGPASPSMPVLEPVHWLYATGSIGFDVRF